MLQSFRGKVAVVTGAGGGLGAALARACAAEGMKVALADVDEAGLAETAAALTEAGAEALTVPTDVRHASPLAALAERCFEAFGACHLLCNNAGVMVNKPILELGDEDWRWLIDVNVMGVVNGVRAFAPRMLAQDETAHIVNTSSMAGLGVIGEMGLAAYTASKHAVTAFTETLALELAGTKLGVSVLCPGGIVTNIHQSERVRPEAYARQGGAPQTSQVEDINADPALTEGVLSPEEAAACVLKGVREGALYILTHPELKALVDARHTAIASAFDAAASAKQGEAS